MSVTINTVSTQEVTKVFDVSWSDDSDDEATIRHGFLKNVDLHAFDGVANGTSTFTSATGGFTAEDEGRKLSLPSNNQTFTISSVVNSNTVTLGGTPPDPETDLEYLVGEGVKPDIVTFCPISHQAYVGKVRLANTSETSITLIKTTDVDSGGSAVRVFATITSYSGWVEGPPGPS